MGVVLAPCQLSPMPPASPLPVQAASPAGETILPGKKRENKALDQ